MNLRSLRCINKTARSSVTFDRFTRRARTFHSGVDRVRVPGTFFACFDWLLPLFKVNPAVILTFVCFVDLLMRAVCCIGCCNELLFCYDTHSKKFDVCKFFTAILLVKIRIVMAIFDDFFFIRNLGKN